MIFRALIAIIARNTVASHNHILTHVDRPDVDRVGGEVPIGADFDAVGADEVVVAAVVVGVSIPAHLGRFGCLGFM